MPDDEDIMIDLVGEGEDITISVGDDIYAFCGDIDVAYSDGGVLLGQFHTFSSVDLDASITLGDVTVTKDQLKRMLDLLDFVEQHPELRNEFLAHRAFKKLSGE